MFLDRGAVISFENSNASNILQNIANDSTLNTLNIGFAYGRRETGLKSIKPIYIFLYFVENLFESFKEY